MDTGTVLEIIKMIAIRINKLDEAYDEGMSDTEYYSKIGELGNLSIHLQSFIEGQLNAAENSTGE